MPFYNREKETKQLKAILSGEPNLVYFVYGPINSGKTALLTKVFEELSDSFCVFYINFRGRYVQEVEDLIKVLFRVRRGKGQREIKEFVRKLLEGGTKLLGKMKGIPIPENIFEILFDRKDKVEDIFAFLEEYFEEIRNEGHQPIFVLDEMQSIKEVINASGRPVISELFNFLVRLTKETHLCHSLCATSDCLFIEDVYSNARLEGRARYILVDDLEKERAFEVYEEFGFKEKNLVWDYVGGKLGDMVRLKEMKKEGYGEKEAVDEMLRDARGKLRWFLRQVEEGEKGDVDLEAVKSALRLFKEAPEVGEEEIKGKTLRFLIEENILFYNPLEGTVRPQSRLLWQVVRDDF